MFTPLEIGSMDNFIAMEVEEEQDRNKWIYNIVSDMVKAPTGYMQQQVLVKYGVTEDDFTDDEIIYINECLQADRVL